MSWTREDLVLPRALSHPTAAEFQLNVKTEGLAAHGSLFFFFPLAVDCIHKSPLDSIPETKQNNKKNPIAYNFKMTDPFSLTGS